VTREELRDIFDELAGIVASDDTTRHDTKSAPDLGGPPLGPTTGGGKQRLALQDQISPFQAKVLVRSADTDQNGSISFAEWEEITTNLLQQLPETNYCTSEESRWVVNGDKAKENKIPTVWITKVGLLLSPQDRIMKRLRLIRFG